MFCEFVCNSTQGAPSTGTVTCRPVATDGPVHRNGDFVTFQISSGAMTTNMMLTACALSDGQPGMRAAMHGTNNIHFSASAKLQNELVVMCKRGHSLCLKKGAPMRLAMPAIGSLAWHRGGICSLCMEGGAVDGMLLCAGRGGAVLGVVVGRIDLLLAVRGAGNSQQTQ